MSESAPPLFETVDAASIAAPLEALLLMATEPMPTAELAQAVRAPIPVVEQALDELAAFYNRTARGFELRFVGGGWRYWTRAEHADLIAAWLVEGQHAKLSQAALETLAVVAYLQPISRSRVSAVRGVNVDGVLRTLVTRDLVQEVDRDPDSGAMLFGTTNEFLERLGLAGLDDLPPIAPYLPDAADLDAELRAAVEPPPPDSLVATPPTVIPANAGISEAGDPDTAAETPVRPRSTPPTVIPADAGISEAGDADTAAETPVSTPSTPPTVIPAADAGISEAGDGVPHPPAETPLPTPSTPPTVIPANAGISEAGDGVPDPPAETPVRPPSTQEDER